MYRQAAETLATRKIGVSQTLYVGNDMLNDVTPAKKLGYRTALFAGDARSLRRRAGHPDTAGVVPDLIVTDLRDLSACLGIGREP